MTAAGFRRGLVAALPFLLSNGAAGLVMGLTYKGLGLEAPQAILFSLLVYSATAQAITLSMWASPLPVAAMVVACIATNSRYLLMGAHLRQLFGGLAPRKILLSLFLLADASWLMTSSDADSNGPDAGYLLGSSIPMAIGWVGGTALAYAAPFAASGPLKLAAALLPTMFIATLLPSQWKNATSRWPWLVSAVVALFVSRFVDPSWSMLIGGGCGTLVSMMERTDA
ncbi:AzlC family ABC transporter permease [Bradyrhizobium sp. ma5]|uniref:AzlC family ABC transporter permease n=1 Tax=Bradyrhizobium sp. ma5 TaxID=3344828 RepID=UPI0035D4E2F8